jgi:hypothetical protein
MPRMHPALAFLAAVLVAAVAPLAAAQSGPAKLYSLIFNPASVSSAGTNVDGTTTITATLKNETPNGNSSINSFALAVAGNLSITAMAVPNGVVAPAMSVAAPVKSVNVQNMPPLKNGKTFVFTLRVKADVAPSGCNATSASWSASVYTGSSLAGDTFALPPGFSMPVTSITAGCTLSFATQPVGTLAGGVIGGPVKIVGVPASAFAGKTITLSEVGCTGAGCPGLGNNAATVQPDGSATFASLTAGPATGSKQLLATTGVSGYPTATSASFGVGASDGPLDCQGNPNNGTNAFGGDNAATFVGGSRGLNKDGSPCSLVQYDLQVGDSTVAVFWDTNGQPNASFSYQVDWKPQFVDPSTGLPKRIKVAWTQTGGNPDYVYGRSCIAPGLPLPYGRLTATTANATSITLDLSSPPAGGFTPGPTSTAFSFPLVVGTERMLATYSGSGTTYNVLRAQGGTSPVDLSAYTGAFVMSTPLPLDANGQQMQVCIRDQEFVTLPPDQCSPQDPTRACVGITTRIFDLGDGWVTFE